MSFQKTLISRKDSPTIDRSRRETLALPGTLLMGSFLSGCVSPLSGNEADTDPAVDGDRLDYETAAIHIGLGEQGAIKGGIGEAHDPEEDHNAVLVRSSEGARRIRRSFLEEYGDSAVVALVEKTEFENAVLLVIEQIMPASNYRLRADTAVRTDDDRLHAVTTIETTAEGGGGAEYLDTLLMRIAIAPAKIQEQATVTIRNPPRMDESQVTFTTS